MAKLSPASQETIDLVDTIMGQFGLSNYMRTEVISISKQKQLIKVARASASTEYLTNKPETILIYVYEEAFERLDSDSQKLVMEDALNQISYDGEKDKILITPYDICVTSGGRKKYGENLLLATEAGVLAMKQIEDEEKERKEAAKASRKK